MNKELITQIRDVRDSGKTNMFDKNGVQRVAFDMRLFELVEFIEDSNSEEYVELLKEV